MKLSYAGTYSQVMLGKAPPAAAIFGYRLFSGTYEQHVHDAPQYLAVGALLDMQKKKSKCYKARKI
jgi:hypothetical protein